MFFWRAEPREKGEMWDLLTVLGTDTNQSHESIQQTQALFSIIYTEAILI